MQPSPSVSKVAKVPSCRSGGRAALFSLGRGGLRQGRAEQGEPFEATVPSSAFAASSAPQIMSRAAVIVAAVALASVGVLGCGYARSRRRQVDERSSAQGGTGSPSSDVELMPDQT